ncbi:MAG: UDP-N-acetylglucosamine pyrophosphorylase [Clostridia bacterium]|nr:UDP-N-acetylglucosamine pyrophosphorylase [Clostridia bacterium]
MRKIPKTAELFDMTKTIAAELFEHSVYPWDILDDIGGFILKLGETLDPDKFERCGDDVWIAKSASVAASAEINGPCIIDENAEIRHCAYIRGKAIVGKGSVVGNSCEVKNAVIFDSVQVPHFNYVGDSVLGYKSHMGAGSVTSNVKSDKTLVTVKSEDEAVDTERKKMGAMLGDYVEVGCNSVLCPGTIVGRNSTVYPLSLVRGVVPENSIFKGGRGVFNKISN